MRMSLNDWDGVGFDDAVAWAHGRWRNVDEVSAQIRRLGFDIPRGMHIEMVWAYVGYEHGDPVPVAVASDGSKFDDSENTDVADETVGPATFVIFAPDQ